MSLLLHLINVMCACCIIILISFPKKFFTDPKLLNSSVYHNCMKKSGHYIHQHSTFVFHRGKNSGLEESEIWIYLLFCVSPPLCISVCRYATLWWQREPNDSSSASPQSARSDTCTESPGKDRGSTLFRGNHLQSTGRSAQEKQREGGGGGRGGRSEGGRH